MKILKAAEIGVIRGDLRPVLECKGREIRNDHLS